MDAISAPLIVKALDGLSARAIVTAQNIANANTPGYRPMRVTFEEALAAAARNGGIEAVTARVEPDRSAAAAQGLRLDLELSTASSTAGRYGALVELLNRRLQIDALAISGGR